MKRMFKIIGMAFSLRDLFSCFPYHKLKTTTKLCTKMIGYDKRFRLVHRVFRSHMEMVIKDVIENNVTFKLPVNRDCQIHVESSTGEDFKRLRRAGKWSDIDFLESRFVGNQICLYINSPKSPSKVKDIYVNSKLKDRLTELTNKRKPYC